MSADRFNDGYAAAEAHWKKRWYTANADHQAAVTEVERLTAERDALAARLAAVEAAIRDHARELFSPALRIEAVPVDRLRAVLSAAPTDTTKET